MNFEFNAADFFHNTGRGGIPFRLEEDRVDAGVRHFSKKPLVPSVLELLDAPPDEKRSTELFAASPYANGVGLVLGADLACLDFDSHGAAYAAWAAEVSELASKLPTERTISGGFHVFFRPPSGELSRSVPARTPEGDTLIEVRAGRSLLVTAPTPGYEILRGQPAEAPRLTDDEFGRIMDAARHRNACFKIRDETGHPFVDDPDDHRPGTEFCRRGGEHFLDWIQGQGWKVDGVSGGNTYLTRPGKRRGVSASWNGRTFYLFSSSVPELEADRGYSAFAVYARIGFGGDFAAATRDLASQGYGCCTSEEPPVVVSEPRITNQDDSSPVDLEDLSGTSLIDRIAEFTAKSSPRECRTLAMVGAVQLVGHLAGLARLTTRFGDRPNAYWLALAPSASGKSYPQRTNRKILSCLGLADGCLSNIGSGQGLEDALAESPEGLLFSQDEFQKFLGQQKGGPERNPNAEGIQKTLLELYSASGDFYFRRRLAISARRQKVQTVFDRPHVTLAAYGIAELVFKAMPVDALVDGLLGRLLLAEMPERGAPNFDVTVEEPPLKLLEDLAGLVGIERSMAFLPNETLANARTLRDRVAEMTPKAEERRREVILEADRLFNASAESDEKVAAQAVWGRAVEKVGKLALVLAASVNPGAPVITEALFEKAWRFVHRSSSRLLHLAGLYAAKSEYDGLAKRVIRLLKESRGGALSRSEILRRMRESKKTLDQVLETLAEAGEIVMRQGETTGGRRPIVISIR